MSLQKPRSTDSCSCSKRDIFGFQVSKRLSSAMFSRVVCRRLAAPVLRTRPYSTSSEPVVTDAAPEFEKAIINEQEDPTALLERIAAANPEFNSPLDEQSDSKPSLMNVTLPSIAIGDAERAIIRAWQVCLIDLNPEKSISHSPRCRYSLAIIVPHQEMPGGAHRIRLLNWVPSVEFNYQIDCVIILIESRDLILVSGWMKLIKLQLLPMKSSKRTRCEAIPMRQNKFWMLNFLKSA